MPGWLLALLLSTGLLSRAPDAVTIATPRGETSVPIVTHRGLPAVACLRLVEALGLELAVDGSRATVRLAGRSFVFELGAPYVRIGDSLYTLVASPYVLRDTLFLPFQWLAEYVPRVFPDRYRYRPDMHRLEELTLPAASPIASRPISARAPAPPNRYGLRLRHLVAVDPGHGGVDPGNPGKYFPAGIREKDITLAIAKWLAAELERRGIGVVLTRTRDTLIALENRGLVCRGECDLFLSIHINAMPPGPRQRYAHGVETYFLAEAKTEDARRVQQMENEAVRFETSYRAADGNDPIAFILKDLQLNEYLRESARLAELVQGAVARIHPGGDRGVQQAGFMVLTSARRPAILVEAGFATHPRDGAFLASAGGLRKIGESIADGVVAYLLEYERKVAAGGAGGGSKR